MDKNFQRVRKKAEKVFAAYDKGERSPRLRAQLSEVRQELEAFLPYELPQFLKRTKPKNPTV